MQRWKMHSNIFSVVQNEFILFWWCVFYKLRVYHFFFRAAKCIKQNKSTEKSVKSEFSNLVNRQHLIKWPNEINEKKKHKNIYLPELKVSNILTFFQDFLILSSSFLIFFSPFLCCPFIHTHISVSILHSYIFSCLQSSPKK